MKTGQNTTKTDVPTVTADEQSKYIRILKRELVPALGCTEPIAIALAAAKAASLLEGFPERMEIGCSSNILKNVMSVVVPNSGGLHGLEAAAILGALARNPDKQLEVLDHVTDEDRKLAAFYLQKKVCVGYRTDDAERLLIQVKATYGGHVAEATIAEHHTNFVYIALDDKVLLSKPLSRNTDYDSIEREKQDMTLKKILRFADTVCIDDVKEVLDNQIRYNWAISEEGRKNLYGAKIGRTLLEEYGDSSFAIRARAYAAAGSEARMSGCCLPVVINSGSGNQGITVSVPVIEYANTIHASEEMLYRAIIVSNLVSLHLKSFIGDLSAFCGAVTAACGAGAAIAYMDGSTIDEIAMTIETTLASAGGIICDGAKPSCAAKISVALEAAITARLASKHGYCFQPGEGIIREEPEQTFASMGRIGREGMAETDSVIFDIMLNKN